MRDFATPLDLEVAALDRPVQQALLLVAVVLHAADGVALLRVGIRAVLEEEAQQRRIPQRAGQGEVEGRLAQAPTY